MEFKEFVEKLKENIARWDNVAQVCDDIIMAAVLWETSDIHIEPISSYVRIRFRRDWVMQEILEYYLSQHQQIVARFKIMAELKIDETRMPQDWRISKIINGKWLDLRVSTLPTVNWEKIVMRLVDKSKKPPTFDMLWITGQNLRLIKKAIAMPTWIMMTSWPTWSGKTTTLIAILNLLNTPDINIMTFEDPVETQVDWVNQSQVKPDIWYTFAYWLRTALRQDPDIIMVWEMRDHETVEIGIEAALTWHMVLSTIHTNSAAETLTRVIQMWIAPFLIPASFNAVIAQRLIRRLCPHCKAEMNLSELDKESLANIKNAINVTPKEELRERVPEEKLKSPQFFKPVWCEKCWWSWYKWRIWLYEVLEITPWVKDMVLAWASATNINRMAIKEWMISLEQDWIIKCLNWDTSLAEVYSAVKTQNED